MAFAKPLSEGSLIPHKIPQQKERKEMWGGEDSYPSP